MRAGNYLAMHWHYRRSLATGIRPISFNVSALVDDFNNDISCAHALMPSATVAVTLPSSRVLGTAVLPVHRFTARLPDAIPIVTAVEPEFFASLE